MDQTTDTTAARWQSGLDVCPRCAKRISAGQRFCGSCGFQLPLPSPEPPSASSAASIVVRTSSAVVKAELARYTVTETPRAAEFSLGIALRTAGRHDKAVDALMRALKEPGTEPPTEDVFLQLAYVHELRGAKDQELRSYLEAVRAAPKWADQILPDLHRMLTPELAASLVGWFASDWETAFSDPSIDAADRLHADLFLCRVHLYSANYEAARAILDRIRKSQPEQFASIVPKLFTPDSLRAAATQEKKGDAILALAQIAWYLRQPQALAFVNEALALGLTGGRNPEAPAYQLRGEALEADGKRDEAAEAFCEAGKRYLWRGENAPSVAALEHAKGLRPKHAPTYWFLMETHRVMSYRDGPPYVDRAHLDASLEAWEAGLQIEEPRANFSWAYSSRALLNEQLGKVPQADSAALNWEAVTLLERAAIWTTSDAYAWAYLGRYHRMLLNYGCANQATLKAIEADGQNVPAVEERATLLSESGRAKEALEMVAKRRQLDATPNPWLDGVEAYNLILTGPRDRVLTLLDRALASAPNDPWYLAMRAGCYRLMGEWDKASEDSRRVLDQFNPDDTSNRSRFAWAAYYVGDFTRSRELFERLLKEPTEASNANRGIGFSALATGHIDEARRCLTLSISLSRDVRDLDELLIVDLDSARHWAHGQPHEAATQTLCTELAGVIAARRAEVETLKAPDVELREILKDLQAKNQVNGWAWLGASAGMARMAGHAEAWAAAAEIYRRLLNEPTRFPDARQGLLTAIEKLIASADSLTTDPDAGQTALDHARGFVETPGLDVPADVRATLFARLGVAAFLRGEDASAGAHFRTALTHAHASGPGAGARLAKGCLPFIQTAANYWRLREAWRQTADDAGAPPDEREDFRAASDALAPALDAAFKLAETAPLAKRLPVVTPLLLEIGDSLLPYVDPAQDGGKFFNTDIPALRQRVEAAMGMKTPGVRARPYSPAAPDMYRIQLDEVPVVEGRASGSATLIEQLESVLLQHMAMYMGVQEGDDLLEEWAKDPETGSIIATSLDTPERRLRFIRLLRALVAERIPITRPQEILRAVRESGVDDLTRALRAVRLRLRDDWLAGGRVRRTRDVPADWQRWVQAGNGRVTFDVTPADAHRLLATVRTWMAEENAPDALVANNLELQRFVRQLVAAEFPDLRVLTAEEASALSSSAEAGGHA